MFQRFGTVLRSSPNQSANDTPGKMIFLTERKRLAADFLGSYIMLIMHIEMNRSLHFGGGKCFHSHSGGGGTLYNGLYETRRLYPKGVAFSGVRFLKEQGAEIYKRQGKSVFPSVKRPNNNRRIKESMAVKKSRKFPGFLTFS